MQIRVFYPYFAILAVLGLLFWYWLRHTPRRLVPFRRRLLMGVRLAVLAFLVAGLVCLSLTQVSQQVNVVFLLDLSHSMAAATRQQALDCIRVVSRHKPPELELFREGALVDRLEVTLRPGKNRYQFLQSACHRSECASPSD